MKNVFAASLFASGFCFSGAAYAGSVGYECAVNPSGSDGWLPEVLFIGQDQDSGTVVVSDPIILHYNDRQPVNGRVKTDNAKRTTFGWSLKVKSSSGQRATITYTATYLKASGEVSMSALPHGYTNILSARGKCTVKPLK